MTLESNPLYSFKGIPPFGKIKVEHITPAVEKLIEEAYVSLEEIEKSAEASWEGLVEPLFQSREQLDSIWWPVVGHLSSVDSNPELRKVEEALQPKLVELGQRFSQSKPVFQKLVSIRESDSWESLPEDRKRVIEAMIRSAKQGGVSLEGDKKQRFNEIYKELSQLRISFRNNGIDSRKLFTMVVTNPKQVAGLPMTWKSMTAKSYAKKEGKNESAVSPETGPWLVDLSMTCYLPLLRYAEDRNLREQLFKENASVASSGEFDNTDTIKKILKLRRELATILGYQNYAELSLESKMAPEVGAVLGLYDKLKSKVRPAAEKEYGEMQAFASKKGAGYKLAPWDRPYWARRMEEELLAIDSEKIREYFPHPHVFDGLFKMVEELFCVTVVAADGKADTWHEDVRFFELFEKGNHVASLYMDLFERPGRKRSGAWMLGCVRKTEDQVPVAYVNANFTPPDGDAPSLLRFTEVTTLFHEMGHALQHMLTKVTTPGASGIEGVEWDAVELPSQFMEYWCYRPDVLKRISSHKDSGAHLPESDINNLIAQKTFLKGLFVERQMHLGLTDFKLYSEFNPDGPASPFDIYQKVAQEYCTSPIYEKDKLLCTFGHIFDGGYAAGYYSYLWADILSADAFAAFEEDFSNKATLGEKFRNTVLALGGSRHPSDVFRDFRGRDPDFKALFRHYGFV